MYNFSLRVCSGQLTSARHCLEEGIITGCTILVSLLSLAMNMVIKSAEVECRGPVSGPKVSSWLNLHSDPEQQDPSCPQTDHHLHQSWAEGSTSAELCGRASHHRLGLAAPNWSRKAAQVPWIHYYHFNTPRCGVNIRIRKASGSSGTDRPLGGRDRRGQWA